MSYNKVEIGKGYKKRKVPRTYVQASLTKEEINKLFKVIKNHQHMLMMKLYYAHYTN